MRLLHFPAGTCSSFLRTKAGRSSLQLASSSGELDRKFVCGAVSALHLTILSCLMPLPEPVCSPQLQRSQKVCALQSTQLEGVQVAACPSPASCRLLSLMPLPGPALCTSTLRKTI